MGNGRACFEEPSINEAYFFSGDQYCRVKYTPDTNVEEITYGPTAIAREWKTLVEAGFTTVDAAFAIRDPDHEHQVYFFSGTQYVRVKFLPGTPTEEILNGPTDIVNGWASLDRAGFDTVDAVLPISDPQYEGQVYVFRGDQYVRVKVNPGVHRGDVITYGPASIAENWPSLVDAGFANGVDAILSTAAQPGFEDQAYFFNGDRYARIKVVPSTSKDVITSGPARIEEGWTSLGWGW